MPANTTPIFVLTTRTEGVSIATSSTPRDGSGTSSLLWQAGSNGSRVDFVTFNSAQVSPTASSNNVGRVFITDASASNIYLLSEIALPTITASASAVGQSQTIFYSNGLLLNSGQQLRASIAVYNGPQDKYHVIARGGDY